MGHKKKHGSAPVPPGNLPKVGPSDNAAAAPSNESEAQSGAPFQEQDPTNRHPEQKEAKIAKKNTCTGSA